MISGYRGFTAVSSQCSDSSVLQGTQAHKRMVRGEKGGKCVYHKSLLTQRSSAKRGEEEGKWCFLFALAFLLLFQIQNYKKVSRSF